MPQIISIFALFCLIQNAYSYHAFPPNSSLEEYYESTFPYLRQIKYSDKFILYRFGEGGYIYDNIEEIRSIMLRSATLDVTHNPLYLHLHTVHGGMYLRYEEKYSFLLNQEVSWEEALTRLQVGPKVIPLLVKWDNIWNTSSVWIDGELLEEMVQQRNMFTFYFWRLKQDMYTEMTTAGREKAIARFFANLPGCKKPYEDNADCSQLW